MKDLVYRDQGETNKLPTAWQNISATHFIPKVERRTSALIDLTANMIDKYIKSEALKTFSDFKSTYLLKMKEIYDRNASDPVAYSNEYDSFVNGVLKKLPDDSFKMKLLDFCGDDKQRGILAITKNRMRANAQSTIKSIREAGEHSIAQLPITLTAGYNESDKKDVDVSLLANFQRAVSGYNARLEGELLMNPDSVVDFVEQYNREVERNVAEAMLRDCKDIASVNILASWLNKGSIKIPVFGIKDAEGDMIGAIIGERSVDLQGADIRTAIAKRRSDIIAEEVSQRQVSQLISENCMHYSITQQAADQYFEGFSDVFKSGSLAEQLECAKGIANKMDILPSTVVNVIERTVYGDPAAKQLANVFLHAWEKSNPKALAEAFGDNPEVLAKAFSAINGEDEPSKVAARKNDEDYLYIIAARLADNEIDNIAHKSSGRYLYEGAERRLWYYGKEGWKGLHFTGIDEVEFDYSNTHEKFSEFFYQEMRRKYLDLLQQTNGDVKSSRECLEVLLSRYHHSDFSSGVSMYAPEEYTIVRNYRKDVEVALKRQADEYMTYAISNGEMSKRARFLKSELVANETTAEDDRKLRNARKNGREYFELPNGLRVFAPTYTHVIHYEEEGIQKALIIGEFNPSIVNRML